MNSLHLGSRAVCAKYMQHTGESTGAKQCVVGLIPGYTGADYKISKMPLASPKQSSKPKVAEEE